MHVLKPPPGPPPMSPPRVYVGSCDTILNVWGTPYPPPPPSPLPPMPCMSGFGNGPVGGGTGHASGSLGGFGSSFF